ncbi:hypothetical protein AtNW77_Chr2g0264731 [Arabidopsis thaliana]|jgi:coenzyme F420-reducing hydrogenase beta subunit|uniref:At2g42395 n=4 Tax=Arabidopsis TaxID=3701 RepID=Q84TF7_ARATH|nr:uncharacterized protein AT2G42395 [Arabidopsis thaliana]KAG7639445.1 hypothetical protein ISN45_At02g037610 [Arabidopsis thaliana x Arabidopsis arenosa]KAG7644032.1 hypothetical protein ISN44_As02g037700 [Arabidopsis suecica]AAO64774.1 At2g42395 [Arabidopsis thaliana]AEC10116.1 hypothetical protein AT2G42395 [Arabidopsis thaliana]OAP11251.1 hypothetical protein AXX17_AT2G39770 [Arabidopsis thaliana]|eukprot:NP_973671.1 hypothetical protein AT2G42395 [Arabidopsis thaliana]
MAKNSGSSFEAEKSEGKCVTTTTEAQQSSQPVLSKEEEKVRDSYLFCCENFYTLPEMINFMKEIHGVEQTTVTKVFRELLKGRKAEAYLRESQKRMKARTTTTT